MSLLEFEYSFSSAILLAVGSMLAGLSCATAQAR
jgi:hypothetical protein